MIAAAAISLSFFEGLCLTIVVLGAIVVGALLATGLFCMAMRLDRGTPSSDADQPLPTLKFPPTSHPYPHDHNPKELQ